VDLSILTISDPNGSGRRMTEYVLRGPLFFGSANVFQVSEMGWDCLGLVGVFFFLFCFLYVSLILSNIEWIFIGSFSHHSPCFMNCRSHLFTLTHSSQDKFDALNDGDDVVLDCAIARIMDVSALDALNVLSRRYYSLGKQLHLKVCVVWYCYAMFVLFGSLIFLAFMYVCDFFCQVCHSLGRV
jgi:hypothetical protein